MTLCCCFCAEDEDSVGKLTNVATAQYKKLCCSGCNGSRKALNKQGLGSATAAAALKDLRNNRQAEYKALVVSSVIPGANAKGRGGTVFKQERKEALGTFFTHSAE
eukprot:15829938-Heterocapsa_arctica.AAC.1